MLATLASRAPAPAALGEIAGTAAAIEAGARRVLDDPPHVEVVAAARSATLADVVAELLEPFPRPLTGRP